MKGEFIMAEPKSKATETKAEDVILADVSKQIADMLAEARKEADKIIAEAKAKASGEKTEEEKKAEAEREAYWNEYVEIELFLDNNKYKDDVWVAVNGESCRIKRGERVKIKRKFAEELELSNAQKREANKLIAKKSSEFAKMDL